MTPSTPLTPVAANVLDRAFEPDAPDRVWAADMTYIATDEGWLYLSVVLDLYSRRVVGWSAQPSLSRRGPVEALTSADPRPPPRSRPRRTLGSGLAVHLRRLPGACCAATASSRR